MSPIYEVLKNNLGREEKNKCKTISVVVAFFTPIIVLIIFFSWVPEYSTAQDEYLALMFFFLFILSIPVALYIGMSNIFGIAAQKSFFASYEQAYNLIEIKTKSISKKKNLKSKEVDKIVKSLENSYFDYDDVLDILGYTEDNLNHESYLKKKSMHTVADTQVTKKLNEKLYFRTHVYWLQGSPENSVIKDVGFFYLSNKRLIFIGNEKSYSINFPKITNLKFGDNYALVCKTAGQNDIFEIENKNSLEYFNFLFKKLK